MGSLPHVVEDCMGVLQLYSDGSIYRSKAIEFPFPVIEDNSIIYKDCLFDKTYNLHLRLYKPKLISSKKLPIILFFHGGGFCVGSRDWPHIHNCCMKLSSGLNALVVAPDYRLAPEHRLPAAMDDGVAALSWLQLQALSENGDAWLKCSEVDFDKVYVIGDSSGGNIAHHLAVRIGSGSKGFDPVRVRGYVLLAPFFGGVARTKSEEGPSEEILSLEILDKFWRLSIPTGESRDHPVANPFGPASSDLKPVALDPILVIVGSNELLRDRVRDYAWKLKDMRKKIKYVEFEGKQHCFFTNFPYSKVADEVTKVIEKFMLENNQVN